MQSLSETQRLGVGALVLGAILILIVTATLAHRSNAPARVASTDDASGVVAGAGLQDPEPATTNPAQQRPMRHGLLRFTARDARLEPLATRGDRVATQTDALQPNSIAQPGTPSTTTTSPQPADPARVERLRFPIRQVATVGPVKTSFAFTELLPSWNLLTPDGTGFRVDVRVRREGETWGPWLYMGRWGRIPQGDRVRAVVARGGSGTDAGVQSFSRADGSRIRANDRIIAGPGANVEVDILVLDRPADEFEMRVTSFGFDPSGQTLPTLKRLAMAYSVESSDASAGLMQADVQDKSAKSAVDWAKKLEVPFRAQGIEADAVRSDICSPTSVGMVIAAAGLDRPTLEHALAIYDDEYGIFGNWNRAVQHAGSLGLEAWLERFSSMDEVRRYVAAGQPVVASIRFGAGEFPSNIMNETAGHLIVIRGFTPEGDAIVNDPASRQRGEAIVYKSQELARAWFINAGGVGYVIRAEKKE